MTSAMSIATVLLVAIALQPKKWVRVGLHSAVSTSRELYVVRRLAEVVKGLRYRVLARVAQVHVGITTRLLAAITRMTANVARPIILELTARVVATTKQQQAVTGQVITVNVAQRIAQEQIAPLVVRIVTHTAIAHMIMHIHIGIANMVIHLNIYRR